MQLNNKNHLNVFFLKETLMRMSPFWRFLLCACLLTSCSADFTRTTQKETPTPQEKYEPLLSPENYAFLREQAIMSAFIRFPEKPGAAFIGERLEVDLDNYRFSPKQVHLKAWTITQITLSNTSHNLHYFGSREFFKYGAEIISFSKSLTPPGLTHIPVAKNSSRIVYLFAKDPGEYPLNCNVPKHTQRGMKGSLFVE